MPLQRIVNLKNRDGNRQLASGRRPSCAPGGGRSLLGASLWALILAALAGSAAPLAGQELPQEAAIQESQENAEPGDDSATEAAAPAPDSEASPEVSQPTTFPPPTEPGVSEGEAAPTEASGSSSTGTSAVAAPSPAAAGAEGASDSADEAPGASGSTAQSEVLEDIVDQALRVADLPARGNTQAHFIIAGAFLLLTFLLRRILAKIIFRILHKVASRTRFHFDNYILPVFERALRAFILVLGISGALMVLKFPPAVEVALRWAYLIAISLVFLVFFLQLTDALLDHLRNRAVRRQLNLVSFMPWIRRIILTIVFVFTVLMIAQWLGGDVRSFLAGLGIGGLAIALAAQDTLANIFGSVVVAVDQPFRLGEFVQIGAHSGTVEDIGLRSTRLRTAQGNLIVIPNKTVAAEPIVNITRFTRRRVEQTFPITYEATPEQMDALVEDIREIVLAEEEVEKASVIVQFTEMAASSLNIWLAYNTHDPDFVKHLKLKQRINGKIMKAVAARGLRFAYPTQSLRVESLPPGSAVGDEKQ